MVQYGIILLFNSKFQNKIDICYSDIVDSNFFKQNHFINIVSYFTWFTILILYNVNVSENTSLYIYCVDGHNYILPNFHYNNSLQLVFRCTYLARLKYFKL